MITENRLEELRRNAVPIKPESGYYGMPLLKEPVWTWEVPAYFFVGGAAGAAAVVGAAAQVAGADRDLVNDARWIAGAGALLSGPLLVAAIDHAERTRHNAVAASIADVGLHVHAAELRSHDRSGWTRFQASGVFAVLADVR